MNDPKQPGKSAKFPPDETILAWLEGELEPAQATAFEARMRRDAALRTRAAHTRQALADARDWTLAEPPGVERVEALPIPRLGEAAGPARVVKLASARRPLRHRRGRVWLARGLAAAAIFVIGFLAGQMNGRTTSSPAAPSAGQPFGIMAYQNETLSIQPPAQARQGANRERVTARNNARPTPAQANTPVRMQLARANAHAAPAAAAPAPRVTTAREENGRVIVETRLASSGGRAVWVVDGGFQVASSHY